MPTDDAPPISASPLDLEHATPELWAALAKAQAAVKSVGKDGYNADKRYSYTTADTMIAAGGAARAKAGAELAVVTAWEQDPIDPPANAGEQGGPGQWPVSLVTLHWAIGHAGGGHIRGTASCHAIGSRARPADKAVAAALTYTEGFVERGLMRLDRDEQAAKDDVDSRQEPEHTASAPANGKTNGKGYSEEDLSFRDKPPAKTAKPKPAAKASDLPSDPIRDQVKEKYAACGGKAFRPWSEVLQAAELLAHAGPDKALIFSGALGPRHLAHLNAYLTGELAAKAEAAKRPGRDPAPDRDAYDRAHEREPGDDRDEPYDDVDAEMGAP